MIQWVVDVGLNYDFCECFYILLPALYCDRSLLLIILARLHSLGLCIHVDGPLNQFGYDMMDITDHVHTYMLIGVLGLDKRRYSRRCDVIKLKMFQIGWNNITLLSLFPRQLN